MVSKLISHQRRARNHECVLKDRAVQPVAHILLVIYFEQTFPNWVKPN